MKTTEHRHNGIKEHMQNCPGCCAEKGLDGTVIHAPAAACGCTTGNLYCYFKNADEPVIAPPIVWKGRRRIYGESPRRPERCCRICGGGAVSDGAGARKKVPADAPGCIRTRNSSGTARNSLRVSMSAIPSMQSCLNLKSAYRIRLSRR